MNQKIENLLQISLAATEEELVAAPELRTGYNGNEKTWEIIFLYAGKIDDLIERYPHVAFRLLMNQYVIAVCKAYDVEQISKEPLTEWIEKPKRLFFAMINEKRQSCVLQLQKAQTGLLGYGVITAIIDSGIDAADKDFRNDDGSSRILVIYDQTLQKEMQQIEISQALHDNRINDIPGKDISGHGTKVAHIACGNSGLAEKSNIIVVKLGTSSENSFPRTTQIMEAVDYVLKKGIEFGMPVAVNISIGNNYGDHMGTSLLERFLNDCSLRWKSIFCIGSGNEGLGATHTGGILKEGESQIVEMVIARYELSINIQIWKRYWDECDIELISPTGESTGKLNIYRTPGRISISRTKILVLYGEPSPYSINQEIYLELSAMEEYLIAGIWRIKLSSGRIKSGRYDIWLPGLITLNKGTGFLKPDSDMSCTIPATAERAVTVGAYDVVIGAIAPFSGRGGGQMSMVKPDLVAPGVDVILESGESCTGTSFSTPFVTGAAALLMEWGIVQGNDPYLYGEKLKAYLIKGARQLPGMESPSSVTGWGALCVGDSLPVI